MATAVVEAVAAVAGTAAVAAPGTQQEAAGPVGAHQQQQLQAGEFDSSRYTLHSQGAEAVSTVGPTASWPAPQQQQ